MLTNINSLNSPKDSTTSNTIPLLPFLQSKRVTIIHQNLLKTIQIERKTQKSNHQDLQFLINFS